MVDPIVLPSKSSNKMLEVEVGIAPALEILNADRMQTSCEVPRGLKAPMCFSNGKKKQ